MKIYLAGKLDYIKPELYDGVNRLDSFYYCSKIDKKEIDLAKDFILDSGAFTFRQAKKVSHIDWYDYTARYADFVKRNNIEKYFELDIDSITGYEEVLKIRNFLEKETGSKCIPVWHLSRGKDEFLKMCDEYPYVAIGGIAGISLMRLREIMKTLMPYLIKEAHKRHAKIHGLGYTDLKGLTKHHFDSVDSTSWLSSARFGTLYKFTGTTLIQYPKPKGMRLKTKESTINNFLEWKKFSEYAEGHL